VPAGSPTAPSTAGLPSAADAPSADRPFVDAAFAEGPFVDAARGRPVPHTPVWFMRQAGRSLPEYRAVRGEGSILQAIKQPEVAAAITLQPVTRYGVDAAVLYSDIVVPAHAVGFGIDVAPGTGPVAERPLRGPEDLARLRPLDGDADTAYVVDTVRLLVAELPRTVPLLAFAGAPFTVASYLIEGRPSRTYALTKALMFGDEPVWHALLTLDLPLLAIAGSYDEGYAGAARKIADTAPGASAQIVEAAGHAPQLQQPERVATLVEEFRAGLALRGVGERQQ